MGDSDHTGLRFQRPWYWLAVLVLGAAVAGALCVWYARERVAQEQRQFRTAQMLRVSEVKTNIDNLFGDAVQLVASGALIYSRIPPEPQLAARITRELYTSALDKQIYGTGAFFVRGGFGRPGWLMSFYVRRYDPGAPRAANVAAFAGGVQIDYATSQPSLADDWTRQTWFREGLASPGRTLVWGPYGATSRRFITVERRFDRGGRPGGVYAVDVLAPDFIALMRKALVPGDVAAVVNNTGEMVLSTAAAPRAGSRASVTAPISFATHSHIVLSSDETPLTSAERSIWLGTSGLLAAICLIAALIAIGLLQRWRAKERERALQIDQLRLEREIAISRTVQAELRKAAYTDALTGLANRLAFAERATDLIAAGAEGYAVLLIDLDRFNIVNETLGHLAGDELLRTIADRLRAVLAEADFVARAGGDEFLLLGPVHDSRPLEWIATALMSHLGEPIVVNGRTLYPEASIGIVAIDGTYRTADEVLRDADIAMYEAKRRGRGRFVIFDAEMRRRVASDSELENALRRALERGEMVPYYQPVIDVLTGAVGGFEALVRWLRSDGIVKASDFMPFAEAHGLVAAIDVRMLEEVCHHSRAIYDLFPGVKIAMNLSASELAAPGLFETIEAHRRRNCRPGDRLELEITETAMMTSSDTAQRTVERLKETGVNFVLDDFGTGYSSLAYLQRLPISGIKIDKTFVAPLPHDARAAEIVRSIVLLARSFGLTTTAEGVESAEQFECVRDLGIDYAQGFFFSPAVDISSLVRLQNGASPRSAVE